MSATPAEYELKESEGIVVEQLIRPTGLLDPIIEVRPSLNQVDDLMEEIVSRSEKGERTLVTTLTKRMAEELTKYFAEAGIRCRYIHSDVDTLERVEILHELRTGVFDALIGVNLLREGLDLPEVSLVAILDADKEGFLRSNRSLTQTAGRAARNINGRVIFYADTITKSMQKTMDETERRRDKQIAYNTEHGLTPQALNKKQRGTIGKSNSTIEKESNEYELQERRAIAADPVVKYMDEKQLRRAITRIKKDMEIAAKELDFMEAARLRDEMYEMEKLLAKKIS